MNKELKEILNSIENENVSYYELSYLQEHKQEVLDTGNARLCEWAGITEDELLNLRKILNENFDEIQEYFHQIYLRFREQ